MIRVQIGADQLKLWLYPTLLLKEQRTHLARVLNGLGYTISTACTMMEHIACSYPDGCICSCHLALEERNELSPHTQMSPIQHED